jgi:hypothetical protein
VPVRRGLQKILLSIVLYLASVCQRETSAYGTRDTRAGTRRECKMDFVMLAIGQTD